MLTVDQEQWLEDYDRIERALLYLAENFARQPGLSEIAGQVGLSEFHFQRLFSRWVGISPKRFLQFLTKEHARHLLRDSGDLLSVAYEAGLSGPGRLHDLFVATEAMTPGEYKQQGRGLQIAFGFHATPFGEGLLASTRRGICGLSFLNHLSRGEVLHAFQKRWPHAELYEDPAQTRALAAQIFAPSQGQPDVPLPLLLKGTNFQIKVWEAMLRIPTGRVVSYEDIAIAIGAPQAVRAVGQAVGANPIPYIIPCHRVIRKMGLFGEYQSGSARKLAILGWEMAQAYPEEQEVLS